MVRHTQAHIPQGWRGTRRGFLGVGAGAVLSAAGYRRVLGANERVGLGLIGYGLIGKRHRDTFAKLDDVELLGVADCHRGRRDAGAAAAGGRAVAHADFRKLLDDRRVQAVVVATPDHWHALMTMLACVAGKDVYVEKPLTLFVREGEWMERIAQRTGRVVQVGTQQRSGDHYVRARQLLQSGHIGTISTVRMASVRNISPGFGSPSDAAPPAELDWDMFLGPAPFRPYNPNRGLYHFRWFWETSGGQMTNLGAHHLDIVDWCLGLGSLKSVSSVGGRFVLRDNTETPDTQDALFACDKFSMSISVREAARGERAAYGLTFYGSRGSLGIDRGGFKVTADADIPPENAIPGVKEGHPVGGPQPKPVTGPATLRTTESTDTSGQADAQYLAHARNFVSCIRTRKTPVSDLASAQRTAIACHLANLSLRLGRTLNWDAASRSVRDDAEANSHLTRPYRAPWDRELAALEVTRS